MTDSSLSYSLESPQRFPPTSAASFAYRTAASVLQRVLMHVHQELERLCESEVKKRRNVNLLQFIIAEVAGRRYQWLFPDDGLADSSEEEEVEKMRRSWESGRIYLTPRTLNELRVQLALVFGPQSLLVGWPRASSEELVQQSIQSTVCGNRAAVQALAQTPFSASNGILQTLQSSAERAFRNAGDHEEYWSTSSPSTEVDPITLLKRYLVNLSIYLTLEHNDVVDVMVRDIDPKTVPQVKKPSTPARRPADVAQMIRIRIEETNNQPIKSEEEEWSAPSSQPAAGNTSGSEEEDDDDEWTYHTGRGYITTNTSSTDSHVVSYKYMNNKRTSQTMPLPLDATYQVVEIRIISQLGADASQLASSSAAPAADSAVVADKSSRKSKASATAAGGKKGKAARAAPKGPK